MAARPSTLRTALAVVVPVLLAASAGVAAGQNLPSHVLLGTVTDSSGVVLPGATVELSLPASTSSERTVVTGRDGKYRFENVVPGLYVLTVRLAGFTPAIRDLEVGGGGEAFEYDVQLRPLFPVGSAQTSSPSSPDRRVVCGLTMVTPRNPDPKFVIPGQPTPAMPFSDRVFPLPSNPQPQPSPRSAKPTMRIVQPTMCWDPVPAQK